MDWILYNNYVLNYVLKQIVTARDTVYVILVINQLDVQILVL